MYIDTWVIIIVLYLACLLVKAIKENQQELEELKQQLNREEHDDD